MEIKVNDKVKVIGYSFPLIVEEIGKPYIKLRCPQNTSFVLYTFPERIKEVL